MYLNIFHSSILEEWLEIKSYDIVLFYSAAKYVNKKENLQIGKYLNPAQKIILPADTNAVQAADTNAVHWISASTPYQSESAILTDLKDV